MESIPPSSSSESSFWGQLDVPPGVWDLSLRHSLFHSGSCCGNQVRLLNSAHRGTISGFHASHTPEVFQLLQFFFDLLESVWGQTSPQSVPVKADLLPIQPSFDTLFVSLADSVPDGSSGGVFMGVGVPIDDG